MLHHHHHVTHHRPTTHLQRAWATSNWEPGSQNASGTRFSSGITAAPYSIPFHSVVEVRFSRPPLTSRYRVEDRERRDTLHGLPHFDLARRGNSSEYVTYRVISLGNGKYVSHHHHTAR